MQITEETTERQIESWLLSLIENEMPQSQVMTFDDAGLITRSKGVVAYVNGRTIQLSVSMD
jgi:hypothetical protein